MKQEKSKMGNDRLENGNFKFPGMPLDCLTRTKHDVDAVWYSLTTKDVYPQVHIYVWWNHNQ